MNNNLIIGKWCKLVKSQIYCELPNFLLHLILIQGHIGCQSCVLNIQLNGNRLHNDQCIRYEILLVDF